jgi:hypothetical protein
VRSGFDVLSVDFRAAAQNAVTLHLLGRGALLGTVADDERLGCRREGCGIGLRLLVLAVGEHRQHSDRDCRGEQGEEGDHDHDL